MRTLLALPLLAGLLAACGEEVGERPAPPTGHAEDTSVPLLTDEAMRRYVDAVRELGAEAGGERPSLEVLARHGWDRRRFAYVRRLADAALGAPGLEGRLAELDGEIAAARSRIEETTGAERATNEVALRVLEARRARLASGGSEDAPPSAEDERNLEVVRRWLDRIREATADGDG